MANKTINVGEYEIGYGKKVFMIAEIGINHNGSIEIAKKLIDASYACNYDCVKFQKRTPDIAVPEHQKSVMRDTPWGKMTYLEYKKKIEFEKPHFDYIDKYCHEKPILWSSSVWDMPSLEFLCKYDTPLIKIPSALLTDLELLTETCKTGKVVVLSTGMSTVEEIDKAVNILEKHTNGDYVIMHTNSSYPSPHEELNLSVIPFLMERYKCLVGYSGHEYDLEPSVVSVVLGACMVERHITLDHDMWGTDQHASLEVHGMDLLNKRIEHIHVMMGDGVKRVTEKELEIRKKLRGY